MDMVWVKSKVTIPRTVPNAIERKKLFTILANNRMKKLTIIRAPAGYGKTTLLCQWLGHIDESVAWFTIDRNDNEPIRFLKYLIHTLGLSTLKDLEQKLSNLLDEITSFETVVDTLLNEMDACKENIHIVFDNFQVIQHPQIHQIFIRLIEYLPANVRIYITTRTDLELPLADWRVKGWMLEVEIGQLCFDLEELQYFYFKSFSNDEQVGVLKPLLKITEGWVAGIQLIKLSTGDVIDNLSSKEILAKATPYIHEFFMQEILSSLPSSIQDFLIRTSILNHLQPSICITITNESEGLATLVDLDRKGVFIERLQLHPPIYRYHTLFRYALQYELKRQYSYEMINSIYFEAATNLCDRGDYAVAIELALNGELYELAHEWIQKYLVEIFAEGHTLAFGQWIQILRDAQYPVDINMLVLYITTLFSMHEIEKANEIIEELLFRQDASKWMDGFKFIAVSKIFEIINAYVTYMKDGDLEKAKEGLQTRVNVRKEKSSLYHISLKYNQFEPRILRTIAGSKGKFLPIEKLDALIHVLCESEIKERNITGVTYGLMAEILYEINDLDRATKELEIALQYGLRFQDPGLFIPMYLLKARIYITKKQFEDAHLLLIKAMKETDKPYWIGVLHIMKAQAYLSEGNISYAQREFFKVTDFINYRIASRNPFYLLVQGRILYAKNQIEEALQIAIRLKEGAIQEKQVVTFIEAGLLEAACHFELEKEESALTILHDTLEQGALYGYCRTFLEEEVILPLLHKYWRIRQHNKRNIFNSVPLAYVNKLLQKNNLVYDFLDNFTSREKDVLQLLAEGASNNEIAQRLHLTEGTIRVYLTEIYSKIGVKSRMKAILWAKQWLGY